MEVDESWSPPSSSVMPGRRVSGRSTSASGYGSSWIGGSVAPHGGAGVAGGGDDDGGGGGASGGASGATAVPGSGGGRSSSACADRKPTPSTRNDNNNARTRAAYQSAILRGKPRQFVVMVRPPQWTASPSGA